MEKLKAFLNDHKKRLIISIVYGIIIMIINNLVNSWDSIIHYCNGAFIAGFSLLCIGGLSTVSYFGGFDMFGYIVRKRPKDGPNESLYDYSMRKNVERKKGVKFFISYYIYIY